MHRRISNTTRYDLKARKISWRVEWSFASSGIHYSDNAVPEETVLSEVSAGTGLARARDVGGLSSVCIHFRTVPHIWLH
jgi:hypothetical protein